MIVCLGWGSLIWEPKDLSLAGEWNNDGPELPVEFVRQSKKGHLTLVIDPASPVQRVLWAPLSATKLADAVEALRIREDTETDRPIGRWPGPRRQHACIHVIEQWVQSRGFTAVVWTALGPKFRHQLGERPTQDEAVKYLAGLTGETRTLAEEYVRKAPIQIDTPYRRQFADRLGWLPAPLQ